MKRHSANMSKPSVDRLDRALERTKPNTKSKNVYATKCRYCGNEFTFTMKDIPDGVIKCSKCGDEEIFFSCNFMGN